MKRFLYVLLSSFLLFGVLVGCSSDDEGDSSSETEETTEESGTSSKLTTSKQKEILGKAAKDFDKLDGITFKDTLEASIESNDIKTNQSVDVNVDLSISPFKYHGKGTITVLGTEFPIEVYGDEDYSYLSQDGKWTKIKLDEQDYDFAKDLTQLQDFLEKDKKGNWADVTKKGSVYSYDLSLDKSSNSDIKDEIKSNAREFLKNLDLKDVDSNIDPDKLDVRIEKYNVKLEIQDKEPRLKKYTIEFDVLAPVGNNLVKFNVKRDFEVKGKYDKRIDIPEEATKASEDSN